MLIRRVKIKMRFTEIARFGDSTRKMKEKTFNFRFSPCIFKVDHFYWPTNALNCIKLKG